MRPPRPALVRGIAAFFVSAAFLLPLVVLVTGSLRQTGLAPPLGPELLPPWPPAFGNYGTAFRAVDLARYAVNSLLVAGTTVPLAVVVASWAGFAISQLPRRLARTSIAVSAIALMVPATATLVGRFALFRALGLTDTLVPLIMPSLIGVSSLYVLLFAWAFRGLPPDLADACRLEGMSPFRAWATLSRLVRPVTVAVGTLAFAATWGNFLDPLIYLTDERWFTLPIGLQLLSRLDRPDQPIFLAASVVVTMPVVIGFLLSQRRFIGVFAAAGSLGRDPRSD
jgi:multiple sugar transport system permease protein